METETADHKIGRPLSQYRDTEPQPMSERQRLAIKERRDQEAAKEAERLEAVRKAEAELVETHRKIAALQRQVLTDPKFYDVDLYVNPELVNASMPTPEAVKFNVQAFDSFIDSTPSFLPSPRNLDMLGDYFERHGVRIVSTTMLERLYKRMIEAGVPFEQLEPEPEPEPKPEQKRKVSLRIAPPAGPLTYEGWNQETGVKEVYSERQVARMSSEQYRRVFRLTPDKLTLPNVGPGPKPQR